MSDPMIENGRPVRGTPLARLADAVGSVDGEHVAVMAGDLADVLRLVQSASQVEAMLREKAAGYLGATISVAARELRDLIEHLLRVSGDELRDESPALVRAPLKARKPAAAKPKDHSDAPTQ